MNTLEIAALGLRQDLERLKLHGHNMVNLSTPAYKRQVAVQQPFFDVLEVQAAAQQGLQMHQDLRAGKLGPSERALDLALPEGAWLLLERADGSQALTRQASLHWDAQGELRSQGGDRVLGQRGAIRLAVEQRDQVSVDTQGQLMVDGQVLDALRLVQLKADVQPVALGHGLLAAEPSMWQEARNLSGVQSGQREQSNVIASQEMVGLMSATRHAESMVRLLQAHDEMMEKAIRRFGDNP